MINRENNENRPKIALALSGASGRAIAHIGVLEVLREHNIPVDYITACSSATMIAASYACGTMEKMKADLLNMDRKSLFNLFGLDKTGKGVFSLDKIGAWVRTYVGDNKLEDVYPRLGFVCIDVMSAEPFLLVMGDIVKAGQASSAVPGLFEPVQWGSRLLVDGGLFSLLPVDQAREMGADIVIGVDLAATKFMYKKGYINAWRGYNFLKKSFALIGLNRIPYFLKSNEYEPKNPHLFTILGKALEIASEQHARGEIPVPDIMLSPNIKHLGKINFKMSKIMYEEGRRAAEEAMPEILQLMKKRGVIA